jgi:hypothetical protein
VKPVDNCRAACGIISAMALSVCTTFPNNAWEVYARTALETFARYWPADVRLSVYLDDEALVAQGRQALAAREATSDVRVGKLPAHDAFLQRNSAGESPDFRYGACRFSHKVAALKATFDSVETDADGCILWLDADVITTTPVTHDWLAQFLPSGISHVSYLGRPRFPYSECGFVGYRTSEEGRAFLDAFWAMYESEALFKLPQWHDSFVFDRVRDRFDGAWFKNSAEGAAGVHVWLNTPLAERLEHWKGPVAKRVRRPISDQEAMAIAQASRAAAPVKS